MGESGKHADGGSGCQRQGEPAAPIHPSRIDMLAHDFRIARQQNDAMLGGASNPLKAEAQKSIWIGCIPA